jgi:eukaryotic-like serine/threonine-protein kinase
MAISSPAELVDWLADNQFLTAKQAEEIRPLVPTFADLRTCAKELIRRDWLTPFQVNQILQGKHEQLLIGSYRLRERIGEGAMGQVFKAVQARVGRVVAVKMIHKELVNSSKALDRFRREVETVSQLAHPNIARVLDAGDSEDRPYLVMEFIDGINLSQRVKTDGALPIQEAVECARQTALGLQHALERGIVHRDIKPANLIVTTTRDDAPLVKILDFGLARFESEREDAGRLTEVGKMLGTIDYVAPEQATHARDADIRADIYSLGCTLFYLLTARPAFMGNGVVEKLGPRVTGEPPWIRTVRKEIPPGLEEIIRKMMARLPDDRYQTPIEVVQALAPYAFSIASAPAQAVPLATPVATAALAGAVPLATPIKPAHDPVAATLALPPTATPFVPRQEPHVPTLELPPMAMPVIPPTLTPGPLDEASFMGMSASGRDMSTAAAAARPATPVAKSGFPKRLLLILGGGVLFLSFLGCVGLLVWFFKDGSPKKPGSLRIVEAKWSTFDKKLVPGQPHHMLVSIERIDFQGPVTVALKDLPKGVVSDPVVFPPNKNNDQIRVTVSIGTQPLTAPIRVVAECEQAGAKTEKEMTLTVKEDPWKLKK